MREMPAAMGVHHISPRLSYLLFQVSKEFTRLEYQEMLYLKGKEYFTVCDVLLFPFLCRHLGILRLSLS